MGHGAAGGYSPAGEGAGGEKGSASPPMAGVGGGGASWGAARSPPTLWPPPPAMVPLSCARPVPHGEASVGVCSGINDTGVPSGERAWIASLGGAKKRREPGRVTGGEVP